MSTEHELNHRLAGQVRWCADDTLPGAPVRLLDDYAQQLVAVELLAQVAGAERADLRCYPAVLPQWRAAWQEVTDAGLLDSRVTLGDVYAARLTRIQPATLSAHALGLAFDLNPAQHPLGADCLGWDQPGSVRALVPVFERWGFRWGGFDQPSNGSHFEVRAILPAGVTRAVRVHLVLDGAVHCQVYAVRGGTCPPAAYRGGDPVLGDAIWVQASGLAKLLGGQAVEPTERVPGPHAVEVTVGGTTTVLTGQRALGAVLVPLAELLPLFGHRARPRPGQGLVEVVPA